jgi:hypothetical protein
MQQDLFDTTSQEKAILEALKKGEKLTPLEMLKRWGCLRASARIYDLKNDGYDIRTEIVKTRSGKRVAEYSLKKN